MIIDLNRKNEFYVALLRKDPQYEGIFFVGVKTTGAFCRSTCPARKPKFENCEFFTTVQEALLASFRPCKRCRPLSMLNSPSDIVQKHIDSYTVPMDSGICRSLAFYPIAQSFRI